MKIKISDLTLECLNKHPVWTWYESSLFESEDEVYPVNLEQQVKNDFDVLFIKAYFIAESGRKFEGSISYDVSRDGIYGFSLFLEGEEFTFNINLKEMATEELQRLCASLNDSPVNIFPLRFACEVEIVPGEMLSGQFDSFV